MAGLFGAAPPTVAPTKYNQLQLQTSTLGLVIPVGWGKNKWAINIIWYGDWNAEPADKGGKGGNSKSGSYTYTAAVILALGEGPIQSIDNVYVDQSYSTLGSLNLNLYNGSASQTPPGWMEDNFPSQALPYAYTAYMFSDLYSLGESGTLPNTNFEVVAKYSGTLNEYNSIPDALFSDIIPDMITNSQYGLDPNATYIDAVSLNFYDQYQRAQGIAASPYLNRSEKALSTLQRWAQLSNTWIFWSGLLLKFVPLGDQALTGWGGNYVPVVTPIVDFTDDDFILDGENTLEIDIIDPWEGFNHFELDFTERSQAYTINPIYWEDQTSVDIYGQLQSQIISASEICSASIGYIIAQLIGKRSTYIRRTGKFKTGNLFAGSLEPGDIITLTSPNMGLTKYPVRITTNKEEANFQCQIEWEEFPYGIGQATLYQPQAGSGMGVPNAYATPPNINPPAIFEPPTSVTGGPAQIWTGASGSNGGTYWGGCTVYLSPDGTNYVQIGTIEQPTPQGTLTAGLPEHADPDLTDTLSVDLTESGRALSTAVTSNMADDGQTPALIDTEILCYGTVSLTGTSTYALDYLRRGQYNTTPAAHSTGDQFYAINPGACLTYNYPLSYVGKTVYFKYCSFNQVGNSVQSLADVTAYPYTILGTAYTISPPAYINPEVVQYGGGSSIQIYASWGASPGPNLASYTLQFSDDGGLTWPFSQSVDSGTLFGYLTTVLPDTNYIARVRAVAINGSVSAWLTSSSVNSGNPPTPPPSAPTSLTANQAQSTSVTLSWTAPTDSSITAELLSRAENTTTFGSSSVVATLTYPTANYLDTGLTTGDEYTYWLTYVNAAGSSPLSNDATVTLTPIYVTSNGTTVTSNSYTLTQG